MNARNTVVVTGYFPDQEKMGKSVMYKKGDEAKKSFYRGKLSVKRAFKTKDGENKYDFLPFTCFGHSADYIHDYAKDGDIIQISGELQVNDNYEDKDGNTVYGTPFIMANDVSIISSKNSGTKESGNGNAAPTKKASNNNPLARLRNRKK